jgi:outer membrane murein-binding lipoprotein Lpp
MRCAKHCASLKGEVDVRLLKYVVVGGVLISAGQVLAQEDTASEMRELKAKLKQLEQRMEEQGRIEKQLAAQAKVAGAAQAAYKAAPPAFDPCASGKICYKGITLTFGGWVDLTGIYRTRNLASDTGSVYNFIPFPQSKNFNTTESRFSARQSRFSVLVEGDPFADTHLAGFGEIDFEGAAQTASSVATNSFNPRMRQLSVGFDRTDIGFHVLAGQSWSLNAPSKAGIDPRGVDAPGVIDFESVPGFLAARQPGIRVWQDIGAEFKLAASVENPQTAFFGGNTPTVGTPAVGPQGVLNPNLLVNLTGPGGSFFNNANNLSLNQVPDVTVKAAWDPRLGPYKLHVEAWGLYRQFFDRFNFANHTYDTGSFGGHISAEVIPQTLELQVYGAHGALGRFTATPFPDATLAQDGTILPLTVTSALVGAVWHTTPSLDIYSYAGLEKVDAAFRNVGTVPFGYGNPLYNNTGCGIENSPAATCNGNTSEVRQYTVGFYDTIFKGSYGTVKAGVQYSYNQRFAFQGVGGAPKTDDNIVMTQIRYYPF